MAGGGVGKFQEGCIGGQVDRRPERKVASWVRVSAPAASAQSSTVFGPQPRPQALPVRPCLLASWSPPSSQPDRRQIHLPGKALSNKRSQSLVLNRILPAGFGSKSARLAQEHNLRVFSHNFVSGATLVVR